MKKTFTMGGHYAVRNYTVRDLLDLKGKQQLTQIMAFSPEEAAAVKEAGIDILSLRFNDRAPAIRDAAPNTFAVFAIPFTQYTSAEQALRAGFDAMEAGADAVYCSASIRFIAAMAEAGIPVIGHVGLVPRKSTWTGGLRAVGTAAREAYRIYADLKAHEEAGALAVEIEVVPHRIATELSKRTSMLTISLGSGRGCDIQYLFAEDILGEHAGPFPRHAKVYRNLYEMRREIQHERVAAFREFARDVEKGHFPERKNLVEIDEEELDRFRDLLDEH